MPASLSAFFFFFNDTATTEIYTLSLHDALPISVVERARRRGDAWVYDLRVPRDVREIAIPHGSITLDGVSLRSEEHTSELQSRLHLVCRLLLEKKKKKSKDCDMQERESYVNRVR